jgi:N-acetylmuramoyl-L-alanine amidase
MTDQQIRNELTHRQTLAATIFGEARKEPLIGQHAVGWVIRNRTLYPQRFGVGWKGVCLRPSQFSCWWSFGGVLNQAAVMAAAKQLIDGPVPAPGSALARALQVADDVMAGLGNDPTNGADHYFAAAAMKPVGRVPVWAVGQTPTATIGGHRFYRLVGRGAPA